MANKRIEAARVQTTLLSTAPASLESLSSPDMSELLRNHQFGRFVFAYDGWPVVTPVNYVFEDPTIVIRTDLGAKLSAAPFQAVAFEIDDADPSGHWGWSVLAQGPAFDITSAFDDRSQRLRELSVKPWAPGVHDHWLTLTAVRLSGRRFGNVPGLEHRFAPMSRLGEIRV